MQEGTYEDMETLWPDGGLAVRAYERKLGEGKLTLTDQSLIFEPKSGASLGFDFANLRLIRLLDVLNVEVAFSVQGDIRSALFRVVCTFTDGTERESLPAEDDSYRMSLFRAITGGVLARFLGDHVKAREEGLTRMTDEKFESRVKDLERNIAIFPDKKQYEEDVWWDDDLKKQSLEAAESEPKIWDDPYRDKLFYTGTNPSMTVDNAFEKLDILQEDWINGRLSALQRAKCVAMDYKIEMRQFEMGYEDTKGGPDTWKAAADKLVQFEERAGLDLLHFV
jgi:hypothetical protein